MKNYKVLPRTSEVEVGERAYVTPDRRKLHLLVERNLLLPDKSTSSSRIILGGPTQLFSPMIQFFF